MTSLLSMNGPSVTWRWPSLTRTVRAAEGGASGPPPVAPPFPAGPRRRGALARAPGGPPPLAAPQVRNPPAPPAHSGGGSRALVLTVHHPDPGHRGGAVGECGTKAAYPPSQRPSPPFEHGQRLV